MSTAGGALIATATVFGQDIARRWRSQTGSEDEHVRGNRLLIAGFGVVVIVIACLLQDVVAALTVAYDILVGGLLVPIQPHIPAHRGGRAGRVGPAVRGRAVHRRAGPGRRAAGRPRAGSRCGTMGPCPGPSSPPCSTCGGRAT
ncbi:hypothetical protein [Pseudonocardia kunmingensis]|uniref:hypothetical protein n=1 Tax=Pseudonocardia kunmingensis TaxID=630975 RepID=UPI001FE62D3C|nr:hypothetical protein [Pseudonocardia kunmingensis]